jgi:hypothetical protein
MENESTAAVVETPIASESNNVLEFARQLKAEHSGDEPVPENGKPAAVKPIAVKADVDIDAIKRAFLDGDVAKLASLIGEDAAKAKVTKSQWAEFRIANRTARRQLDDQRSEVEKTRAEIAAEKERFSQETAVVTKARQAAASEDYETAIELLTGKTIDEVIAAMLQDQQNPANREVRKLRRETESLRNKTEQEQLQARQQVEQRAQVQAVAEYHKQLSAEIAEVEIAKPFLDEYGAEFAQLVFAEQKRHWDGQETISTERATRNVLRAQLTAYDRGAAHFDALRTALGQSATPSGAAKNKSAQGNRGARLSSRKPASSSQGGAPDVSPNLSRQEKNAIFARQLKALHS